MWLFFFACFSDQLDLGKFCRFGRNRLNDIGAQNWTRSCLDCFATFFAGATVHESVIANLQRFAILYHSIPAMIHESMNKPRVWWSANVEPLYFEVYTRDSWSFPIWKHLLALSDGAPPIPMDQFSNSMFIKCPFQPVIVPRVGSSTEHPWGYTLSLKRTSTIYGDISTM